MSRSLRAVRFSPDERMMTEDSDSGSCLSRAKTWHKVIIVVVVALLLYWAWRTHTKKMSQQGYTQSEGYGDVYFNPELSGTMYTRPTFVSNLDPNNPNLRFDPNAPGGFIRGNSPPTGMLAATNTIDTRKGFTDPSMGYLSSNMPTSTEGFRVTLPSVGLSGGDPNSLEQINNGVATGGMTDAAGSVNYSDFGQWNASTKDTGTATGYPGSFQAKLSNNLQMGAGNVAPVVAPEGSEFEQQGNNFSSLINEVDGSFAQKRQNEAARFQASLTKKYQTSSQELLDASNLLPVPDMRQSSTRDPSDPANYMYDRTIFAKLKPRYNTVPDRIRGDLSITPLRVGWFDVTTTPSTDLSQGYFGTFTDIQQTQDLQDAIYTRDAAAKYGSANDTFTSSIDDRVNQITKAVAEEMSKPKLQNGILPPLNFGPLQNQYTTSNPWYGELSQSINRSFASP